MPPKPSSPVKSRTLNSFFTKDEPPVTNGSTAESNRVKDTESGGPISPIASPEKKRPRKRTIKVKETSENQAAPAKSDLVAEASSSIPQPQEAEDSASIETHKLAESQPLSLTNTKEAPSSPNKAASTVTSGASGTNSNSINKLNKIDSASMFKVTRGKAYITEPKLKFSTHPSAIADLCRFHEYRETLRETEDLTQYPGTRLEGDHVEITNVPAEHYGLIAKLVEESELLLAEMATTFMATLCPLGFEAFGDMELSDARDGDENMDVDQDVDVDGAGDKQMPARRSGTVVSAAAIIEAVQAVAQRVNYGIPVSNLPGPIAMTPPNLSVYRWEVQDIDQFFPADMKAAVTKRRAKRMEASAALTAWFLGLDAKQQEDLCPTPVTSINGLGTASGVEKGVLAGGKRSRLSIGGEGMDLDGDATLLSSVVTDMGGVNRPGAVPLKGEPAIAAAIDPAVLESKLKEAEAKKKEVEAKEERRLEKERKMAEKQLEKDMREAERLQKEEAKKRKAEEERLKKEQTAMRFVGFFKPMAPTTAKKDSSQTATKNDATAPSLSELFHPFHIKKNTTLAPVNRFAKAISKETIDIEIKLDMKSSTDETSDMEVDSDHRELPSATDRATARKKISTLFSKAPRADCRASQQRKKNLPSRYRQMTVPEVIQSGLLLQDEDENTDYNMLTWNEIPSLRMRLLQYAENYRPAYFGTWSKRSKYVTGRRFLGKDTELIDYDFDSEAEWEEDEEGEECKSDDDEEDIEDAGSDQDEEDDWLVPEGYLSEDEGLDAGEEGGSKPDMSSQKKSKEQRRPALAQMTPIIVGPVFETTLGECSTHPALEPYHIEFLGDYGIGMDMYYAVESSA